MMLLSRLLDVGLGIIIGIGMIFIFAIFVYAKSEARNKK